MPCRVWGIRLKRRLARIELWAEKQGLELAADCHLARLSQAAMLLHAQKVSEWVVLYRNGFSTKSMKCCVLSSVE